MSSNFPDWSAVRCVLLDMDGTLLDLAFDNHLWLHAVPERYAQQRGLSLDAARAELAPRFQAVAHTLPWYDLDHWTRLTGVGLAALHEELRPRVRLLEGSLDFLRAVAASGRELWLTTNAHPDSWRPKLAQTDLTGWFRHIVSSHDLQAPKEDARYWQGLADRYGMVAAECLFADDSRPVLEAARAFGVGQIVAMNHPDSTQPPRVFEDFFSVPRLDRLLPLPARINAAAPA